PIDDIEKLSGIKIERNRRNGRKQELHLKLARAVRDTLHEDWREGNGRKPKAEAVREWQESHPNGTKAECHRETGLDPKTIRKWWSV
ncbi:MAG: hypothetical protein IJN43_13605, partial [Ruminococcus sp.]|nr:hypothetical protein [Ruminococcus sp.]